MREMRIVAKAACHFHSFAISSNCGARFTGIRIHVTLQDSIFIHLAIHQTGIVYFYMSPLVSLVSVTPIFRLMLCACMQDVVSLNSPKVLSKSKLTLHFLFLGVFSNTCWGHRLP